uniref:Uncharacterized protein n=1 Tax=Amphimedon queenslandica TaxID=400682 RepID=A0A1X7SJU1_AMPQE
SPSQSTNSNELHANATKEAATGGTPSKEPIYSDLGVAPSTGTKPLPKTEAPSVNYADIESVRPKPKGPPVQSYDDVVVSASGTTVIGATGGDPPPIPDKKSKGATTTGQEGARNLPHHVNDDSYFSSAPPSRPPPLPPHASVEGRREEGRKSTVATYL